MVIVELSAWTLGLQTQSAALGLNVWLSGSQARERSESAAAGVGRGYQTNGNATLSLPCFAWQATSATIFDSLLMEYLPANAPH